MKEPQETQDLRETTSVNLGISLGTHFTSFAELDIAIKKACRANYVRFRIENGVELETLGEKMRKKLNYKPELKYYSLKYACFFSDNGIPSGIKRKKDGPSTKLPYEKVVGCPAAITIKLTNDGNFLEVFNVEYLHNHPVSEKDYQQMIQNPECNKENANKEEVAANDKYKAVYGKAKLIAQLVSFRVPRLAPEILQNLDDYIFYLEYTGSKLNNDNDNNSDTTSR